MVKKIEFTYDGKDYCLEYTRRTVEEMENAGFNIDEITNKPMTMLPLLFRGSFRAHHRNIKPALVDIIFKAMPNKEELFAKLSEMYFAPIDSLMEESEGDEGNIMWGANW